MPFKRPTTWQRIACHVLYWSLSFAITYSQFIRAFQDKPNKELLNLVSAHQFLTTLVSFFVLGYLIIPSIWYQPRTSRDRAVRVAVAVLVYYLLLCANTYALLTLVEAHFGTLPLYLARRVDLFLKAKWYSYFIDPSMMFFIYGQFISYVTTPLLIKAIRDGYVRNQAQLAAERERRRLEVDNLALEKENIMKDLLFLRQQINPHFFA